MSIEENKALVRRFFAAWNEGKLDDCYALLAPEIVDHAVPPGFPPGLEGVKQSTALVRRAFPDGQFTIEDLIAEGEQVVARWTVRAIHSGDFFGIPPTGKQVAVAGIDIVRLTHGKAVEHWRIFDQLGLLQQLGVVPASGQASSSPP